MKIPELVQVIWSDPTSLDDWVPREEAISKPASVISCGHLLETNSEYTVICMNYSTEDEVSQSITIPNAIIESLTVIMGPREVPIEQEVD